jgi:hypothetical protein
MGYLTLNEAAKYATNKKGFNVEPSVLLRAGVYGVLIIVAPFPFGTMYNATESKEEDFKAGLLIIPPSHLLEIEAEGFTTVEAAFSSDGNHAMYFPRQERTLGQLCILITDLDKFIINLIDTTTAQAEPVADVGMVQNSNNLDFSELLNTPSRIDDWFTVIDDMTRAFHAKHGKMPNDPQAWNTLWTSPPEGYKITTGKISGDDCLIMQGASLSKSAFRKRWKKYTNRAQ